MFPPYKAFKKQKSRAMTQFPDEMNSVHVCSPWTSSYLHHLASREMVLTSWLPPCRSYICRKSGNVTMAQPASLSVSM